MNKVVLFGAGKITEVVYCYMKIHDPHEVMAFTVDEEYITEQSKFGLPVVPFGSVQETYPPDEYDMMVAVGYQDGNRFRARKCEEAKAKGYRLVSFIEHSAHNLSHEMGWNCLILENVVIQPGASIGNNVFLWSGNHIGHHSKIEDHCYLAGHVIVGGSTVIEPYCFIGINATIGHEITIGEGSFIGAGALITKDVAPGSVHITRDTPKFRLPAEQFLRLTRMK